MAASNAISSLDLIVHHYTDPVQECWYVMDRLARGYCKICMLTDDPTYFIFSELSVSASYRNNGIGDFLLQFSINSAVAKGLESVWLWVEKDSWKQDWYVRRGFILKHNNEEVPGTAWMEKQLKK